MAEDGEVEKQPQNIVELLTFHQKQQEGKDKKDPWSPEPGKYVLQEAIPSITLGDGLNHVKDKSVIIQEVTNESPYASANDAYAGDPFKIGDKIAMLGEYEIPVRLDTFQHLLKQRSNEVILSEFAA